MIKVTKVVIIRVSQRWSNSETDVPRGVSEVVQEQQEYTRQGTPGGPGAAGVHWAGYTG